MIKSILYDYSNTCILVKVIMTAVGQGIDVAAIAADRNYNEVILKTVLRLLTVTQCNK